MNLFILIYDKDIINFEEEVNNRMCEGWSLHGNVIYDGERYIQAMTRVSK